MAELRWRQRAMRPSSTSKTSASGISAHAKYRCISSPDCRYDITENSAPTPQKAFASVNQSARWNSRIIEKGLGRSMARRIDPSQCASGNTKGPA